MVVSDHYDRFLPVLQFSYQEHHLRMGRCWTAGKGSYAEHVICSFMFYVFFFFFFSYPAFVKSCLALKHINIMCYSHLARI